MSINLSIPSNAKPVLDFIGDHEAPKGYAQVYGRSRIQPPKPLTEMTFDEVLAWQDQSVAAGSPSSAAGRYQFIRKTLRSLKTKMGLTGQETFDDALQDRLAFELMVGRGWNRFEAGEMSATAFGNSLAKEWASLPVLSGSKAGQSYYAGDGLNSALTSPEEVLAVLTDERVASARPDEVQEPPTEQVLSETAEAEPQQQPPEASIPGNILAQAQPPSPEKRLAAMPQEQPPPVEATSISEPQHVQLSTPEVGGGEGTTPSVAPGFRSALPQGPRAAVPQSFLADAWDEFRDSGPVRAIERQFADDPGPAEPGFSFTEAPNYPGNERHYKVLQYAGSQRHFDQLLALANQEEAREARIATGGRIVAPMLGVLAQPETIASVVMIPGSAGMGFIKSSTRIAGLTVGFEATAEFQRQGLDPNATRGEAAMRIGASTLMAGSIAGIIGHVGKKGAGDMANRLGRDIAAMQGIGKITEKLGDRNVFWRSGNRTVSDEAVTLTPAGDVAINAERVSEEFENKAWREMGLEDDLFPTANHWAEFRARLRVAEHEDALPFGGWPFEIPEEITLTLPGRGVVTSERLTPTGKRQARAPKQVRIKVVQVKRGPGKPAAAFNDRDGVIELDPDELIRLYDQKAWTKPRELADGSRAKPLPKDAFETEEDWINFVINHEIAHVQYRNGQLRRRGGAAELKTMGAEEDFINRHALKAGKRWTRPITPEGKKYQAERAADIADEKARARNANLQDRVNRTIAQLRRLHGDLVRVQTRIAGLHAESGKRHELLRQLDSTRAKIGSLRMELGKDLAGGLKAADDVIARAAKSGRDAAEADLRGIARREAENATPEARAADRDVELQEARAEREQIAEQLAGKTLDPSKTRALQKRMDALDKKIEALEIEARTAADAAGAIPRALDETEAAPPRDEPAAADGGGAGGQEPPRTGGGTGGDGEGPRGPLPRALAAYQKWSDDNKRELSGHLASVLDRLVDSPYKRVHKSAAHGMVRNLMDMLAMDGSIAALATRAGRGPTASVFMRAKLWEAETHKLFDAETKAYEAYLGFERNPRFADVPFRKMASGVWRKRKSGEKGISIDEFRRRAARAHITGKADEIPEVNQYAESIKEFYRTFREGAEEVGVLGNLTEGGINRQMQDIQQILLRLGDEDAARREALRRAGKNPEGDPELRLNGEIRANLQSLKKSLESRKPSTSAQEEDYFTRVWRTDLVQKHRAEFAAHLNRVLSRSGLAGGDLDAAVNDIIEAVLQSGEPPSTGLLRDVIPGSIKRRLVDISNKDLVGIRLASGETVDFIETEAMNVASTYAQRMGAYIELARDFNGTEGLKNPHIGWKMAMLEGLRRERGAYKNHDFRDHWARIERDLRLMKDRVMHATMAQPWRWDNRAASVLKDWATLVFMGKAALSTLPDMGKIVMVHGQDEVLRHITMRFDADLRQALKRLGNEARAAGALTDVALGGLIKRFAEVGTDPLFLSGAEKFIRAGANRYFVLNFLGPVTYGMRQFSGAISAHRFMADAVAFARGEASEEAATRLHQFGITPDLARRIAKQADDGIAEFDAKAGVWYANTDNWTDLEARRAYRAALGAEIDNTILVASAADKPTVIDGVLHFRKTERLRELLTVKNEDGTMSLRAGWQEIGEHYRFQSAMLGLPFQFWNYMMAATNKVLVAGAENPNTRFLIGATAMMGLGYTGLSIRTPDWAWNKMSPIDKMMRVVDQSGITGTLTEYAYMAQRGFGGITGVNPFPFNYPWGREPSLFDAATDLAGAGPAVARNFVEGSIGVALGQQGAIGTLGWSVPGRNHIIFGDMINGSIDAIHRQLA